PTPSRCSNGTSPRLWNRMKRIEVKLSLSVVEPLLEVIRELSGELRSSLATRPEIAELDPEFKDAWTGELLASQGNDIRALLGLFEEDFHAQGVITFDESNAEPIVRACTALRLRLRERRLKGLGDEALETGDVDIAKLDEPLRKAFMCYLFLA